MLALPGEPEHFIAAAPGTVLVSYDNARDRVWKRAVVAWAYARKAEIEPVTATGVGYSRRKDAVIAPDGSVDNAVTRWANESAWSAWAVKKPASENDD